MLYAVKFYGLHFRRQCFGRRHRSAMGQAVRVHGEYGLRFGVRLSDDCYRSVVVWAKGTVKAQRPPIPRGYSMSVIWLSVMSALASLDMSLALLKSSQEIPAP